MSAQLQLLQGQLRQTSEWLSTRMGGHDDSVQALLEAKNELLAMQQVIIFVNFALCDHQNFVLSAFSIFFVSLA